MKIGLLCAVALASFAGCALNIVKSNPRPNIAFREPTGKTLALKLVSDIQSEFHLASRNGIAGAHVRDWRDTLSTAFQNGFREYFNVASSDKGDLVLELSRADIELAPTAVSAQTGVTALEAHITYKAKIVDGGGKTLKVATNTVVSKKSIVTRWEVSDCVASAVESMYEDLAKELF